MSDRAVLIVDAPGELALPEGPIPLGFAGAPLAALVTRATSCGGPVVVLPQRPLPPAVRQGLTAAGAALLPPAESGTATIGGLRPALAALPPSVRTVSLWHSRYPFLRDDTLHRLHDAAAPMGACLHDGAAALPLLGAYEMPWLQALAECRPDAPWSVLAAEPGVRVVPFCDAGQAPAPWQVVDSPQTLRALFVWLGWCEAAHAPILVEWHGGLRMRTGIAGLPLHADTIATACIALRRILPGAAALLPDDAAPARHHRFALDGHAVTADGAHPLQPGQLLLIFSASVGG